MISAVVITYVVLTMPNDISVITKAGKIGYLLMGAMVVQLDYLIYNLIK